MCVLVLSVAYRYAGILILKKMKFTNFMFHLLPAVFLQ